MHKSSMSQAWGCQSRQKRTIIPARTLAKVPGISLTNSLLQVLPGSLVADDTHMVTSTLGKIDAYDRVRSRWSERLLEGEHHAPWAMSLSRRFLIARQFCVARGLLAVFARLPDGRFDRYQ